jgi:hypothetical protein
MANVYGLDTSIYPGKAALDWYWSRCGFRFTGFYLGPAPYHSDKTWMNARDELAADGWGFLPTYVGLQIGNRNLNVARGEKDGQQAARLMGQAGFPTHTICYLDLEDGTVPSGSHAKYIVAWVRTLRDVDYVPGFYCSPHRGLVSRPHAVSLDLPHPLPDKRLTLSSGQPASGPARSRRACDSISAERVHSWQPDADRSQRVLRGRPVKSRLGHACALSELIVR